MLTNLLRRARVSAIAGWWVILAGWTGTLLAATPPNGVVPGELVVRFQRPVAVATTPAGRSLAPAQAAALAPQAALQARAATAFEAGGVSSSVRALDAAYGLAEARPVYVPGTLAPRRLTERAPKGAPTAASDTWVLRFPADADLEQVRAAYAKNPQVRYAEYNREGALAFVPSDPLYGQTQADLALVGMEAAWNSRRGVTADLVVAVIDSGVDPTHRDLVDALDRRASYNFPLDDATIFDDQGHGTRVAGTIGAIQGNGIGIAGVAFGCTLISLDVAGASGSVTSADVASAINWAVDQGADVANLSLRFTGSAQALADACANAEKAGLLLVAAAGNENQGDSPVYPASYGTVIGVAATMDDGVTRASFSNYNGQNGKIADLAAPGVTVFSTTPGSQYNGTFGSGTSFAAPIVSGVAALVRAAHPGQSVQSVRAHLLATATPLGDWAGSGRVNAAAALATPMRPDVQVLSVVVDDNPSYNASNNGSGTLGPGERGRLYVTLSSNGSDAGAVTGVLTTASPGVAIAGGTASFGAVPRGSNVSNTAMPFGPITIATTATLTQASFTLQILDPSDSYSATRTFTVPVEHVVEISGTISSQMFQTGKTYHVTGDLALGGVCTVQAGVRFAIDPMVNITLTTGTSFATQGSSTQPDVFTSSKPFGYTGTDAKSGPSPQGPIGPQTEPVDLASYGTRVVYVDAAGGAAGGTGGRRDPFGSIRQAFDAVSSSGNATTTTRYAVLVAEGTYYEGGAVASDYTSVFGGFEATGWTRDVDAHRTVIDGSTAASGGPVLTAGQLSRIDGLVLTHGSDDFGACGGVSVPSGRRAWITNNFMYDNSGANGAGIACGYSSATIRNNLVWKSDAGTVTPASAVYLGYDTVPGNSQIWFSRNIVGGCTAAGLYCNDGVEARIDYNAIVGNNDSGIVLQNSSPTIDGNWIVANRAYQGAGINCSTGASPVVVNNVIAVNVATSPLGNGGAALCLANGSVPTLYNNLIEGNTDQSEGAAIVLLSVEAEPLLVANTILSDNVPADFTLLAGALSPVVDHCNIPAGWAGPGTGNFGQDSLQMDDIAWGTVVDAVYDSASMTTTLFLDSSNLPPHALAQRPIGLGASDAAIAGFIVRDNTPGTITIWGEYEAKVTSGSGAGLLQGRLSVPWTVPGLGLTANSPCIGAGAVVTTDTLFPAADINGRPRSGATCDVGPSQYVPLTAFAHWGKFMVPYTSTSFQQCIFENGMGVQAFQNAAFPHCTFRRNADAGLWVAPGAAAMQDITADHNRDSGIVAPGHNLTNCAASFNRGNGIEGALLTSCTALANAGGGLLGTQAINCSADLNTSAGCTVGSGATGVLARGNGLDGIVMTSSGVTSGCLALLNGGHGFWLGGTSPVVAGCVAAGNGEDGVYRSAAGAGGSVTNCRVNQNQGQGVRGVATIGDSQLFGNGDAAATSATVYGCYVSGNGSGILNAVAVGYSYVAGNTGPGVVAPPRGTTHVTSSTIARNGADGVRDAEQVSNCWVAWNKGRGVAVQAPNGAPAVNTVTKSSVLGNAGAGLYYVTGADGCNISGNGVSEPTSASLPVRPNPWVDAVYADRDYATRYYPNCYWGAQNTLLLDSVTTLSWPFINMPFVIDANDGLGTDYVSLTSYTLTEVPDAPNFSAIPPFIMSVYPADDVTCGVGSTTFTLVYSQAMQTAYDPAVTFGASEPYTQHIVRPMPGWVNATTWQGVFVVQSDTGDGPQTMRIANARSTGGFWMPDDLSHGFAIDANTTGSLAANNGLASASGQTMDVSWTVDALPAGTEGFNVTRSDSATPGTFQAVSDSLVPAGIVMRHDRNGRLAPSVLFHDTQGLAPSKMYWYVIEVVDAGGNASQWTPPFFGTTNSWSVSEPVVVNRSASRLTGTRATLGGRVEQTGGEDPNILVYWGATDGGDDPDNWDHVEDLGTRQVGDFSVQLTQLSVTTQYYFRCQAANSQGSVWSPDTASFVTTDGSGLTVPTGVAASDGAFEDRVRVAWNAVTGASYYCVSRATWSGGSKTDLSGWQAGTTFDDTSATTGTIYYYFIRSATDAAGANPSNYSVYDTGYAGEATTIYQISYKGCDASVAGTSMTVTNATASSSIKIALLKKPPKTLTDQPGTYYYAGGPLSISVAGSMGKFSSQLEVAYLGATGTVGAVSTQGCAVEILRAAAVKSVKMAASPNSTGAEPIRLDTCIQANGGTVPSAMTSLSVGLTGIGLAQLDTPGQAASVKIASKTGSNKATHETFVSLAGVGSSGVRVGGGFNLALTGGDVLGPIVAQGAIKGLSVKSLSVKSGASPAVYGGHIGAPADFPATVADLPADPLSLSVYVCAGEAAWVADHTKAGKTPLLVGKVYASRGAYAFLVAGFTAGTGGAPVLSAPTFAGNIGSISTPAPDTAAGLLGLWGYAAAANGASVKLSGDTNARADGRFVSATE